MHGETFPPELLGFQVMSQERENQRGAQGTQPAASEQLIKLVERGKIEAEGKVKYEDFPS